MSLFIQRNVPLIHATVEAFLEIQRWGWPDLAVRDKLSSPECYALPAEASVQYFADTVEELCLIYPNLRVFWKDADLRFLGMNKGLAADAGLFDVEAIVGLRDDDEKLPWKRQAAKYQRDDRRVMKQRHAEFDIVERQDAGRQTRWIRTSKAPIIHRGRTVGLIGGMEIISDRQASAVFRGTGW